MCVATVRQTFQFRQRAGRVRHSPRNPNIYHQSCGKVYCQNLPASQQRSTVLSELPDVNIFQMEGCPPGAHKCYRPVTSNQGSLRGFGCGDNKQQDMKSGQNPAQFRGFEALSGHLFLSFSLQKSLNILQPPIWNFKKVRLTAKFASVFA